ncbi:hypothetical protein [Pseudomonas savastanoi]|uniref:hypothetical protein n=1 Tax=Pseudomonas savastanoi TaxID=29438 RepID=UPI000E32C022|nr:hypothetical protein [Pseudomonas savastanoi]
MAMYILGGLILLAIIFLFQKQQASGEVFNRFGLRENAYRMLSTDLGKSAGRIKLARFGINGIADAVFEAVSGNEIVVGEFKSRKYRNMVKLHEFYQLTLYMGHLKALHPKHTIRGVLAYADGKVSITYDPDVYEGLVRLKGDYWDTVKRRTAGSTAPLHKRMKVNGMNRGIRLSTEL